MALVLGSAAPAAAQGGFSLGGSDSAPSQHIGEYSLNISAVTTLVVSVPGIYRITGTVDASYYAGYGYPPYVNDVTLTIGGQTAVSEGGFIVDLSTPLPAGWNYWYNGYYGGATKSLDRGVFLPAGTLTVQLTAHGTTYRGHQYHDASLTVNVQGAASTAFPSVEITEPHHVCQGATTPARAVGDPPGGVFRNWRISPTSVATVDASGGVTGVSEGTATLLVDYTFPGWDSQVTSPPFTVEGGPPLGLTVTRTPGDTPLLEGTLTTFTFNVEPEGGLLEIAASNGVQTPGTVTSPPPDYRWNVAVPYSFGLVAKYTHPDCPGADATVTVAVIVVDDEGNVLIQVPQTQGPAEDVLENTPTEGPCSVTLHNGEQRFSRTDLVIPGRGGMNFTLTRRYRSRNIYDGPLGHCWDFNFDQRLASQENGDVLFVDNGRVDRWASLGEGRFQAPRGFFSTLIQRADMTYVLRESDGSRRTFTKNGQLHTIADRHGNRLLMVRGVGGRLLRILDPYDRPIDFTWEAGRITKVTDFMGREVAYTYDLYGDLVSARSPRITGTSTGDDQPNGRTERYTYSSGFSDPNLNHNLLSVTRPEEVSGGGPAYLVWTYGNDANDDATYDRVLTQDLGGTNASGVPAGGRIAFTYEQQFTGMKTTVVDRNGNTTEHYMDHNGAETLVRRLTRGLRSTNPAGFTDPVAFEVRSYYDPEGRLTRRVLPEGNETRYVYDTSGVRAAQNNVIEVRQVAGPRGGGADQVTTMTYEPLCQQVATVTDPRGNDPTYVPSLGTWSASRYTTRFVFDYQEGNQPVDDAVDFGISLAGIARDLHDQNYDGRTDQVQGNVVRVERPTVTLRPDSLEALRLGSTSQAIVSETIWNDRGQRLSLCDEEGNVTEFAYHSQSDPNGDGVVDSATSLPAEASGYLAIVRRDARTSPRRRTTTPPLALEERYHYDPIGNVTRTQNARGVVTRIEVNVLGELVRVVRGAEVGAALASGQLPTGEAALGLETRFYHDLNGRVVRTAVENRGGTTPGVGQFVERFATFDILDHMVETAVEIDGANRAITRSRYDMNENLVLVERPNGQRMVTLFDERDLPFLVTQGEGTADASTVQIDYDRNGNRKRLLDAEDTDGDGQREATTWAYDGFDRMVQAVDAIGNQSLTQWDVSGNIVRRVVMGHPAADPTGVRVLLKDTREDHDELGRVFRARTALSLTGALPATRPVVLSDEDGDGWLTTLFELDARSRLWAHVNDDLQVEKTTFDGASRAVSVEDALGNLVSTEFDRNGNPTRVTTVEKASGAVVPDETFVTRYVWDQLDRLVRVTDNVGQTASFGYDARNNQILRADAVGPLVQDPLGLVPGQINGPGNTTTTVVDGLDRILSQARDLRVGGQGGAPLDLTNPANPDGKVTTTFTWDASSRLLVSQDDKGNSTSFQYDFLDRVTRQTFADGTYATFTFDRDGNLRESRDPNGSVVTRTRDALNRITQVDILRGTGVEGTTRETFAWDGLSRNVRQTDDNGGAQGATSIIERTFDSNSMVVEERQNGQAISWTFSGDERRTSLTYPGGRVIGYGHDVLDRITRITDGTGLNAPVVAEYAWIGAQSRVLYRRSGNNTALTLLDDLGRSDTGYDAVARVVRLRHVGPAGQILVDRGHGYDRANNRTHEQRFDDFGLTDRYTYDSVYRVVGARFDDAGPGGGDPTSGTRREVVGASYQYDGAGNRVNRVQERLVQRARAALHARHGVTFGSGSQATGDVVVDSEGGQDSSVDFAGGVAVQGNVAARRVDLGRNGTVNGNVQTDQLVAGSRATVIGNVAAYSAPPFPVQTVAPVTGNNYNLAGNTVFLTPGTYGTVTVKGGSLVLTGGTVTVDTLKLGGNTTVEVRAPVLMRVRQLDVGHGITFAAGALTAGQVRWEIDTLASFGGGVAWFGELLAPRLDLKIGGGSQFTGWVEAQTIKLASNARVTATPGVQSGRAPTTLAYTVNSLNQYTTVGGVARSHDLNGNLTDDGQRRLVWDYRNRLVRVVNKASGLPISAYTYDGGNRRVSKTTYTATGAPAHVTRSFWDGWDLIEEQNGNGVTEATYVSGPGSDEHLQVVRTNVHPLGPAVLWCHQDARGNVVAATDAAGSVVERTKFDDFGRPDQPGSVPHGFQGRYRDAETGWVYFRNRYYDPDTGRFLSRDPVWDPVNVGNLYTFAGNGPHNRDPLGLAVTAGEAKAAASGALEAAKGIFEPVLQVLDMRLLAYDVFVAQPLNKLMGWNLNANHELYSNTSAQTMQMMREGKSLNEIMSTNMVHAGETIARMGLAYATGGASEIVFAGTAAAKAGYDYAKACTPAQKEAAMRNLGAGVMGLALSYAGAKGIRSAKAAEETRSYNTMRQQRAETLDRTWRCFVAGTLVACSMALVPIEDVRVGQRVDAVENGSTQAEIDPKEWALFDLTAVDPADPAMGAVSIQTLRRKDWLEAHYDPKTGLVDVEFDDFKGCLVRLDAVKPCPPIEPGRGRVVLSTMVHRHEGILRVRVQGLNEPLEVTDSHVVWNETRRRWLRMGEFLVGDEFLTWSGPRSILSIERLGGARPVYNLEVEGVHNFRVTPLGILVHNENGNGDAGSGRPGYNSRRYAENDFADQEGVQIRDTPDSGSFDPVEKGQQGVIMSERAARNRGETILGDEITFDTEGGTIRPDLVSENFLGERTAIDSKFGPGAHETTNQLSGYPALETKGGTGRGQNARDAGLEGPQGPMNVRIDKW